MIVTRSTATASLGLLFTLLTAACQNGGGKDQHPDNHNPHQCLGTSFKASDQNNYSTWSDMKLPVIKVKPLTELSFDWGSVTKDFITHPLDARKDLNMILVLFFQLPLADLEKKLNADSLTQNDLVISPPLTLRTNGGDTSASLFGFNLNGVSVTPDQILKYFDAAFYNPANYTYAVAGATGLEVGSGIRIVQAFQLDPSSSNTDVRVTDSSTQLDWTANLHDLTPTGIPAAQANVVLDWGDMTKTGLGTPFDPTQISKVLVNRYDKTSGQLEKDFLNLELITTELYETTISAGTSVDFSTMKRRSDGKAFTGIDDTGTWLVALQCGACRNPSPWYLSILKPCP